MHLLALEQIWSLFSHRSRPFVILVLVKVFLSVICIFLLQVQMAQIQGFQIQGFILVTSVCSLYI